MERKVQTVLGPIDGHKLGMTLCHEHMLHSCPLNVFTKSLPENLLEKKDVEMVMENLCWYRQYPYSFIKKQNLNDAPARDAMQDELRFFKRHGGGSVVDNGSIGLRSSDHAEFLVKLSQETGVNIVAGAGYYVASSQNSSVLNMKVEEMATQIRQDMIKGIDGTDIKCGMIGEIGCSFPLHDFERRSLAASAVVQQETGCPVIIHPGRHESCPAEICRVFQEAGGDITKTVMSHLDRTLLSPEKLCEFAKLGSYCEFDLFGTEVSYYQQNEEVDMPSDAQRISRLFSLVKEGYIDRLLISHDIHTKHRLMKFGGHGFSHIKLNIMPQMLKRGFTDEDLNKILVSNPRNWLMF